MRPPRGKRRPAVVANWKMYLGSAEQVRAAVAIQKLLGSLPGAVDVVLCPSFPLLPEVRAVITRRGLALGAQDVHQAAKGPHTGDVSVEHVRPFVRYVIVGHSERRAEHGETDDVVAEKAAAVLRAGLHPILCVGETREEREAGDTVRAVRRQVLAVLAGLPVLDHPRLLVAYEPVWAVSAGPGRPAPQPEPHEVAEVVGLIRRLVAAAGRREYAEAVRILYGGSVTARTVRPFVAQPGVDGVLVGGESTKPAAFAEIALEVAACHS